MYTEKKHCDGFEYYIKYGKAFITNYPKNSQELIIPEVLDGLEVFGLDFVIAPPFNSEISSLFIPKTVCFIDNYIFDFQFDIKSVTVDKNNPVFMIKDGALINKEKKSIQRYFTFEKNEVFKIPEDIKIIEKEAFANCDTLITIEFNDILEIIENGAFFCCKNLTWIYLPPTVKKIGNSAFAQCPSLFAIQIAEDNQNYSFENGILIEKGRVLHTYLESNKKKKYTVDNFITEIGDYAFSSCVELENVKIPKSVIEIGKGAFCTCINLKNITLPNSIRRIKPKTFSLCVKLGYETAIVLPNSIIDIDHEAFFSCYKLRNIILPTTLLKIGIGAFSLCEKLETVIIPKSVREIGSHAFDFKTKITRE